MLNLQEFVEKIEEKFGIISNEKKKDLVDTLKEGIQKFKGDQTVLGLCKKYKKVFNDLDFDINEGEKKDEKSDSDDGENNDEDSDDDDEGDDDGRDDDTLAVDRSDDGKDKDASEDKKIKMGQMVKRK